MPTEFGKYVLQRKLAEGGMAEVFLAKQRGEEGFEKPVVIKRILPHLSDEEQFVAMFLNEAKVAARLSHPSVAQIFDFGRVDGQYFLVMEFIHGEDLRHLSKQADKKNERPPFAITARIIADVLGGLHYAHTRMGSDGRPLGLVHRDVSPQNVIVTYEGGVKLIDFGIAKATESATSQQTQAGMLKGKYAYMSPEQTRGKQLDARSDVFAVGILLWEFITWKRLFRRDSDLSTLVAVADEDVPTITSVMSGVPAELERICMKALARARELRYPSAQAMRQDLETLIRKEGWEADGIVLQRYMRELFSDKLRQQDDAIREAGVGSIEDFLVRVEEGTRMAWIEAPSKESSLESLAPPVAPPVAREILPEVLASAEIAPMPAAAATIPTMPVAEAITTPETEAETEPAATDNAAVHTSAPEHAEAGAMTMRAMDVSPPEPRATEIMSTAHEHLGAPTQMMPTAYDAAGSVVIAPAPNLSGASGADLGHPLTPRTQARDVSSATIALPPRKWRRAAVIAATGLVVAGIALGVVLWPAGAPSKPAAPAHPFVPMAKLRITLDENATIAVDGVVQPPGSSAEVPVTANASHEVRVTRGTDDPRIIHVPPLDPGSVQPVHVRLGN